jgi:hypothetical protein
MSFDKQEYNRAYYQANRDEILSRGQKRYEQQKAVKEAEHKRLCEAYAAATSAGVRSYHEGYREWMAAYLAGLPNPPREP